MVIGRAKELHIYQPLMKDSEKTSCIYAMHKMFVRLSICIHVGLDLEEMQSSSNWNSGSGPGWNPNGGTFLEWIGTEGVALHVQAKMVGFEAAFQTFPLKTWDFQAKEQSVTCLCPSFVQWCHFDFSDEHVVKGPSKLCRCSSQIFEAWKRQWKDTISQPGHKQLGQPLVTFFCSFWCIMSLGWELALQWRHRN